MDQGLCSPSYPHTKNIKRERAKLREREKERERESI